MCFGCFVGWFWSMLFWVGLFLFGGLVCELDCVVWVCFVFVDVFCLGCLGCGVGVGLLFVCGVLGMG